ncbi:hypothetical protein N7G274_000054 [Stereocaulon virgatum]|uniref:Uncharacterized protein n=1 Tax=Stereocaulon virgatum TaxID=373712 RepID=A0ABR4AXF3_9LECA
MRELVTMDGLLPLDRKTLVQLLLIKTTKLEALSFWARRFLSKLSDPVFCAKAARTLASTSQFYRPTCTSFFCITHRLQIRYPIPLSQLVALQLLLAQVLVAF